MSKQKQPETFLDFCDKLPPCLVRAMAMTDRSTEAKRMRYRLMTHLEIAEKAGLPPRTVQRIGASKSWDGIKLGTASKFIQGCGVDIVNRDWLGSFVTTFVDTQFDYMTAKQKNYFYRLMNWKKPEGNGE